MRGAALLGGGRVAVNLIAFISTLFLARLLTPQDFGLVALVTAISAVTTAVTDLSLNQALIQLDSPKDNDYHTAFTLNLIRAAVMAALMLALSWPMAVAYKDDRLVGLMALAAVIVMTSALDNPKLVVLERQLRFDQAFVMSVTDRLVASLVAVTIAFLFRTYWALIVGTLVAAFVRIAMSYGYVRYRPRFSLNRWREFVAFSVWLTLGQIVLTANVKAVPLVVGAFLPGSAVGQYSVGERLASMPIRESVGTLQSVLFPAFARLKGDLARLQAAYLRAQATVSLFAFPAGFGLAVLAPALVPLLVGEKWVLAVPVVQAVAIASAVMAMQNIPPLALAMGRQKDLLFRNLRVFVIQLPLLAIGMIVGKATSVGGLAGLAIALCASSLINTSANLWLVRSIAGIAVRRQIGVAIRPMLASFGMATVLLAGQSVMRDHGIAVSSIPVLATLVAAGSVVYAALLALFWQIGGRNGVEAELMEMARRQIGTMVNRRSA